MSTDTQFDGQAFIARADEFDAKTITDALALAAASTPAELSAVIATLPGFQGHTYGSGTPDPAESGILNAAALGILSEYTRQIVAMYQREKNRVADLETQRRELQDAVNELTGA